MNPESLALLEYESLRALVGRWIVTEPGRRRLAAVEPVADRHSLDAALAETAEAIRWLGESSQTKTRGNEPVDPLRFDGLPDAADAVAKLRIEGAVLDSIELRNVAHVLERSQEIRRAVAAAAVRFPLLARRAASIADFRDAIRAVTSKILPNGAVADHASPLLARLRRDTEKQKRHIHESLERFLKDHREDGLLQEDFITIRNDRLVVPIVPSGKKKAAGVVHGSSGSGHTLFLEPLETIELNNDLVRLTEEELREIHRILRELTAQLRRQSAEAKQAVETLGELDFLFAKARFAEAFDCVIPSFSPPEDPHLHLRRARHPLLEDVLRREKRPLVPVSFELDSRCRTLLISGPNTGGKTVSMKTVGLLSLMAQSALPVPAEEAVFPLFEDVLADIGDNQSIEQSLSSFSSHVIRIREMVEASTPGALVLLDELGRATDPEEGGALGIAIIEEFRAHGAFTIASTHLQALKVFGATAPGVLNASMGFNEQTLEPTFELRTGAPGKSAGLETAARLGLAPHLIERARLAMSGSDREVARLLRDLESRIGAVSAEADALRQRQLELERREQDLLRGMEKRESARLREIDERATGAVRRFEKEAREAIDRALSAPEMRKEADRVLRSVSRARREMKEELQALAAHHPAPAAPSEGDIREGSRVRLKDVSHPARVLRVLSGGLLETEVGLLKMQVPLSDVLEVLPPAAASSRLPQGVSFTPGPRFETLTRELNIIGKTSEEAAAELDRFLDASSLADVVRVRIVHGHGMGILRKMVREALAAHPLVEKFYPATPAEGGTGATIAEMKTT